MMAARFLASTRRLYRQFQFQRGVSRVREGRVAAAHRDFAAAARAGHTDAQFHLGMNYSIGRGCVRAGSEAIRWFESAAQKGHVDAQFELGVLLLAERDLYWSIGPSARWVDDAARRGSNLPHVAFPGGLGVKRDNARAFKWLRLAAEAGKAEAQANLGWLLLKGIGCEADRKAAHRWLISAAEHKIGQAAFGLAEFYGASDQPEYAAAESRQWLRRAADLGNISAAYNLGKILSRDTDSNAAEIKHYLAIAAKEHHPEACFDLASLLISLMQQNDDIEQVHSLLRTAAKAGHVGAAFMLGEIFSRGDRVRPDLREAAHWYRIAAEQGYVQAQFQIGCFYARGEGVPKDLCHAARFFKLSAEGGHAVGALNAGIFYETGQGVARDLDEAVKWLRMAADQGLPQAQVRLGTLLTSLGEDTATGRTLLEQAAAQESPEAELALAQMLLNERNSDNARRAAELLARAADKHNFTAAELLLTRFEPGQLSPEILARARVALEAGAAAGHPLALATLASELLSGRHFLPDHGLAEQLLKTAVAQGDAGAHFTLGVFYCQRNATADDIALGLAHYVLAAEAGHPVAQYNAGVMYLNGVGTVSDRSKAILLLQAAADQGLANASQLLAHHALARDVGTR